MVFNCNEIQNGDIPGKWLLNEYGCCCLCQKSAACNLDLNSSDNRHLRVYERSILHSSVSAAAAAVKCRCRGNYH